MFEYKKEIFFCGIDPSLTANAIVLINQDGEIVEKKLISTDRDMYLCPEQRILDIFDQMKFIPNIVRLEAVYVEGLSFMSTSPTLFERCALLYMLTTHLFKKDIRYSVIPPTSLKKWHTTDGHADKDLMMKVAKCRWNIDFKDDNICDAYCLAMMALEDYKNGIDRNIPKEVTRKRKQKKTKIKDNGVLQIEPNT